MKKCNVCGSENTDNSKFCVNCGNSLNIENYTQHSQQQPQIPQPQQIPQQQQLNYQQPAQAYQNQPQAPNKAEEFEQIILSCKYSKIRLIFGIILFLLYFGSGFLMSLSLNEGDYSKLQVNVFYCLIILVIFCFPGLRDAFSHELVITSKRVHGKSGLIKTKEMDAPLDKIQSVSVSSGLFGKTFNYGTIKIVTASSGYKFKYVKSPNEFNEILMSQIDEFKENKMKLQMQQMADMLSKQNQQYQQPPQQPSYHQPQEPVNQNPVTSSSNSDDFAEPNTELPNVKIPFDDRQEYKEKDIGDDYY